MRKKGRGHKKIKCISLPYEKLLFYQAYARNIRFPSNPPYIKLWKPLTHFIVLFCVKLSCLTILVAVSELTPNKYNKLV